LIQTGWIFVLNVQDFENLKKSGNVGDSPQLPPETEIFDKNRFL